MRGGAARSGLFSGRREESESTHRILARALAVARPVGAVGALVVADAREGRADEWRD